MSIIDRTPNCNAAIAFEASPQAPPSGHRHRLRGAAERGDGASPKGPLYISSMKTIPFLLALTFGATLINPARASGTPPAEDPFIWLEEAHSQRAMNWVKTENARTDAVLEGDPRFKALF